MTVFVDTSALFAIIASTDTRHESAAAAWRTLLAAGEPMTTTNYVMVETMSLLQRRIGLPAVRDLIDDVGPEMHVHWIQAEEHAEAVAHLLGRDRRQLSLVDCTSFVVMRRLGIGRAFAFDSDFKAQGFEVL